MLFREEGIRKSGTKDNCVKSRVSSLVPQELFYVGVHRLFIGIQTKRCIIFFRISLNLHRNPIYTPCFIFFTQWKINFTSRVIEL